MNNSRNIERIMEHPVLVETEQGDNHGHRAEQGDDGQGDPGQGGRKKPEIKEGEKPRKGPAQQTGEQDRDKNPEKGGKDYPSEFLKKGSSFTPFGKVHPFLEDQAPDPQAVIAKQQQVDDRYVE